MGYRLEVTTHPQFSTEELAFQLAEAMQGVVVSQRDIDSYNNQLQIETRKIAELEFLIRQVKAFKKNPPEKISRMEPLASYDVDSLECEIENAKQLRASWAEKVANSQGASQKHKEAQAKLQRELADRKVTK